MYAGLKKFLVQSFIEIHQGYEFFEISDYHITTAIWNKNIWPLICINNPNFILCSR